ncbi:MAG TPA: hypothetical protein VMB22_04680 [Verrucomicrobiae bacterium]|nr:hypothetical protein [Verrucomicrobiae bacterium]
MVNAAKRLWPACILALLCNFSVHAKDLADYRVGDVADTNIITPVALDVVDPDATVTRKAEEALKTPAIFRSYPDITNQVEKDFLAVFARARTDFLADYNDAAKQLVLAGQTNALPDVARLVTDFNRKNKIFPLTESLARTWARGGDGTADKNTIIERFRQAMRRPIRPDDLPAGLVLGDTLLLVPAGSPQETLTLDDAQQRGKIATTTSVATLSRARTLLREQFPKDEQAQDRALEAFLRPDCYPDENLTAQFRARQTAQLVVLAHFDAGQIVARQGQVIDAKTAAALAQLNEKMLPGQLDQQIAAERDRARREQEQAQAAQAQAAQAGNLAQSEHKQALQMHNQAVLAQLQALQVRERNNWLLVALSGVSVVALAALWISVRTRRRAVSLLPARVEKTPAQNPIVLQADLAPQLAQALKEAVVQELAAQRGELLKAQQSAALEIGELVHRLDQLHAPMQDRLRTYETRIEQLEKELAARSEENRELLKLKIEMIRRQLESERARSRVEFN